ncbi:MAG: hypothetical protein WCF67_16905 [Chitinophagaceae bacterium]
MPGTKACVYLCIAVLLSICFTACKKDDIPNPDGLSLSKIISKQQDSVGVVEFGYDNSGRVNTVFETVNGNPSQKTSYFYDGLGKLATAKHEYPSTNVSVFYIDTFSYQGNYITERRSGDNHYFKSTFAYDAQGRLAADTAYWTGYTNSKVYVRFVYDNNDNLMDWEYFYHDAGTWHSLGAYHATYTNSINPYYNVGVITFITNQGIKLGDVMLSKHLVAKVTGTNGSVYNFSYEYYNNGLVKKSTVQSGVGSWTDEFFYE